MIVVSDSTIFIGLAKIKKIDLLRKLFHRVYIPEAVHREVVEAGDSRPGAKFVRDASWIIKKKITDYNQVHMLMASLERGEAEVLVLAKEIQADIILMDEDKARKSAVLAGYEVMGLIGVLIVTKRRGLISNVGVCIEKLQQEKFRIGERIITEALKQAGEASQG